MSTNLVKLHLKS